MFIFLKIYDFCSFFKFSRYCQILTTGKGFSRVYKHNQPNCTYPYPNTTVVVPPRSLLSSQRDSTNDCGVTVIAHTQPSPVSNLTKTNQVDTDINNYDNKQSFETPRKKITAPLK